MEGLVVLAQVRRLDRVGECKGLSVVGSAGDAVTGPRRS